MLARTKVSSANRTPPVFRICTEATCPRKKTWSGKSLLVISDALRTVSLPAAPTGTKPLCSTTHITITHAPNELSNFTRTSSTGLSASNVLYALKGIRKGELPLASKNHPLARPFGVSHTETAEAASTRKSGHPHSNCFLKLATSSRRSATSLFSAETSSSNAARRSLSAELSARASAVGAGGASHSGFCPHSRCA